MGRKLNFLVNKNGKIADNWDIIAADTILYLAKRNIGSGGRSKGIKAKTSMTQEYNFYKKTMKQLLKLKDFPKEIDLLVNQFIRGMCRSQGHIARKATPFLPTQMIGLLLSFSFTTKVAGAERLLTEINVMKALIFFAIYAMRAHEIGPKLQKLEPGGKIPPLLENLSICNIKTSHYKQDGQRGCKKFIDLLLQTGLPPYM